MSIVVILLQPHNIKNKSVSCYSYINNLPVRDDMMRITVEIL